MTAQIIFNQSQKIVWEIFLAVAIQQQSSLFNSDPWMEKNMGKVSS